MEIERCNGCEKFVIMYEEAKVPFCWCNKEMKELKQIKQCGLEINPYKNKDP
jgi:serine/threonine-protein kinase RIO1